MQVPAQKTFKKKKESKTHPNSKAGLAPKSDIWHFWSAEWHTIGLRPEGISVSLKHILFNFFWLVFSIFFFCFFVFFLIWTFGWWWLSFEWSMVVCWLVAVFLMVGGVLVVVFPSDVEFFFFGGGTMHTA